MITDVIWSLQDWLQHSSAEGGFLSVSAAHPPKDLKASQTWMKTLHSYPSKGQDDDKLIYLRP